MFKRTSKLASFPECPHCGARAVVTAPSCRELACCSCGTITPMRSLEQVRADLAAARTGHAVTR